MIDWLDSAGIDVTPVVHDGGHELRGAELEALSTLFADPVS
ncbi:MAG: hypothetical protein OXD48_09935 [Litoreibacter sp.]|nr:hypothetical protein [Litoreibacter sp.]